MSELSQLIEIAKNIENQNNEIIRLLKKIAGEDKEDEQLRKYKELLSFTPDFGELYSSDDAIEKIEEKKAESEAEEVENHLRIGSILDNVHDIGEVYFLEGKDIFKLSVKNNETIVDNLTGEGEASGFELQEMIANETIKNNVSLDDGTVILNSEQSQNLPETLRICVEQGAKKVYMPIFSSAQLVGAPHYLMTILKLDFYRSEDQLLEKLF